VREMVLVEREKSGELLRVMPIDAVCDSKPLVAVMVGVALPRGALPETARVTVVFPDVVTVDGLKAAPTPGGSPETENVTGPENAPSGVMERT
jgi:hypothetical protein